MNTKINTSDPEGIIEDANYRVLTEYFQVRKQTEDICAPLEIEDYGIQTVDIVSPPKWHLAHVSWFFETFLLKPYLPGYKEYHPIFEQIFNSYYNSVGDYHPRGERGLLSRPTVSEVYKYRAYVDRNMQALLEISPTEHYGDIIYRTKLGVNHEQQHQELMLTDIKHIFAYNPLKPVYRSNQKFDADQNSTSVEAATWIEFSGGLTELGYSGDRFAYDNEFPRHKTHINNFLLASTPVTNAEYIKFIESGAYQDHQYWFSDAWKIVRTENWNAPLYWQQIDNEWWYSTLGGMQRVDPNAPVCHVSFYEASAYAAWIDARLPSEAEWEFATKDVEIEGNFYDDKNLQPTASNLGLVSSTSSQLEKLFGDVWEWTQSPYTAYPGYKPAKGALGEYNGKFMSNQIVLRGGSCATSKSHIRSTYRNFFYPEERWQFCGFRLAKDIL